MLHDEWTTGHDLALVFGALAYGNDLDVNADEMERLVAAVRAHETQLDDDDAREIVLEALSLLLGGGDTTGYVLDACRRLYESLSPQQREDALETAISIAEADGRLVGSERAFIHALAEAWHLKRQAEQRLAESSATTHEWTLLHDVALMMLAVAHSSDAHLSPLELTAITACTHAWSPARSEEDVRGLLGVVLRRYREAPAAVEPSAERIGAALSPLQRLALVSDLYVVAEADDAISDNERGVIGVLKQAWGLGRYTPSAPAVS